MYSSVSSRLLGAVVFLSVAAGAATTASAITLQVDAFTKANLAGAQSALAAYKNGSDGFAGSGAHVNAIKTEGFESLPAWNGSIGTTNPVSTQVGTFTTLGGLGTGGAAINGGTGLEVRNDNPFFWGRLNTTGGNNWLDSNDTYGMTWDVGGLGTFNSIAFLLTDAADVGAKFSLDIGGTLYSNILGAGGRLANGNIQFVRILLDAPVTSLAITMSHDILNDGFGIDGVTVASIAPIPVPPAAALLLTGLAALTGLRRRRRAQAL